MQINADKLSDYEFRKVFDVLGYTASEIDEMLGEKRRKEEKRREAEVQAGGENQLAQKIILHKVISDQHPKAGCSKCGCSNGATLVILVPPCALRANAILLHDGTRFQRRHIKHNSRHLHNAARLRDDCITKIFDEACNSVLELFDGMSE